MQGVKLFYRVLESMLKAEQDRTGRSSFGSLLSSASFHKCLAACCFEVVIASYRMVRSKDTSTDDALTNFQSQSQQHVSRGLC